MRSGRAAGPMGGTGRAPASASVRRDAGVSRLRTSGLNTPPSEREQARGTAAGRLLLARVIPFELQERRGGPRLRSDGLVALRHRGSRGPHADLLVEPETRLPAPGGLCRRTPSIGTNPPVSAGIRRHPGGQRGERRYGSRHEKPANIGFLRRLARRLGAVATPLKIVVSSVRLRVSPSAQPASVKPVAGLRRVPKPASSSQPPTILGRNRVLAPFRDSVSR